MQQGNNNNNDQGESRVYDTSGRNASNQRVLANTNVVVVTPINRGRGRGVATRSHPQSALRYPLRLFTPSGHLSSRYEEENNYYSPIRNDDAGDHRVGDDGESEVVDLKDLSFDQWKEVSGVVEAFGQERVWLRRQVRTSRTIKRFL